MDPFRMRPLPESRPSDLVDGGSLPGVATLIGRSTVGDCILSILEIFWSILVDFKMLQVACDLPCYQQLIEVEIGY